MITVEKLRDDLDYWIHIGIGDDIVRLPLLRPEYQHLVRKFKDCETDANQVAELVLIELKRECFLPMWRRPTFWRLVLLGAKNFLRL